MYLAMYVLGQITASAHTEMIIFFTQNSHIVVIQMDAGPPNISLP